MHGSSRALFEEVTFDAAATSPASDWMSYPILDIMDAPEQVDIVLIDRPELPASGAGEPLTPAHRRRRSPTPCSTRQGVRLRTAPFTRDRMKAALRQGLSSGQGGICGRAGVVMLRRRAGQAFPETADRLAPRPCGRPAPAPRQPTVRHRGGMALAQVLGPARALEPFDPDLRVDEVLGQAPARPGACRGGGCGAF